MITDINHVGICVKSIDETLEKWKKQMNAEEIGRASYASLGQTSAMIKVGNAYFELMEPYGEGGVVLPFLEKHGEGIHHVSLHSSDLSCDIKQFIEGGTKILGKEGDPAVFTHPKTCSGVLFEITEGRNERVDL